MDKMFKYSVLALMLIVAVCAVTLTIHELMPTPEERAAERATERAAERAKAAKAAQVRDAIDLFLRETNINEFHGIYNGSDQVYGSIKQHQFADRAIFQIPFYDWTKLDTPVAFGILCNFLYGAEWHKESHSYDEIVSAWFDAEDFHTQISLHFLIMRDPDRASKKYPDHWAASWKGNHDDSTPIGIVMQDLYEPWKKADSNYQRHNPWLR